MAWRPAFDDRLIILDKNTMNETLDALPESARRVAFLQQERHADMPAPL